MVPRLVSDAKSFQEKDLKQKALTKCFKLELFFKVILITTRTVNQGMPNFKSSACLSIPIHEYHEYSVDIGITSIFVTTTYSN